MDEQKRYLSSLFPCYSVLWLLGAVGPFLQGCRLRVYLVPLCLPTHHTLTDRKNLLVGCYPNALPGRAGVYLLAWCLSRLLTLNSTMWRTVHLLATQAAIRLHSYNFSPLRRVCLSLHIVCVSLTFQSMFLFGGLPDAVILNPTQTTESFRRSCW